MTDHQTPVLNFAAFPLPRDVGHDHDLGGIVGAQKTSLITCDLYFSFPDVERIWRAFECEATTTPYQCYDWIKALQKHVLNHDCSALIVVEKSGDRPAALLPLMICKEYGLTICRWFGGSYANYQMPLFVPELTNGWNREDVMEILRQIAKKTSIAAFEFVNQPKSWRGHPNPFACLPHALSPSPVYAMSLTRDFDTLVCERRSAQSRQQHRRKLRNLESAHGPVVFRRVETAEEFERVLDAMIVHRRARFLQLGIPDVFRREGVDHFLRETWQNSRHCPGNPKLVIDYLACEGHILATYTGVMHHKRYSCFINSIDPDATLNRFSPGELLLAEVIRQRCAAGDADLDLGIGFERYKQAWCEADTLVDTIVPTRPIGHLFLAARFSVLRCKGMIKSIPALRRLVRMIRRGAAPSIWSA
jgi:CelD/BcsL family acetyltransferase involved in cellulose biosynthesis